MNLESISRQDCTLKIVMNKELFYLLGVYLTDGSITKKNFDLQVIDKEFAEFTLQCWKKFVPKTKAYLRERNDTGSWNKQKRYVIKLGIGEYANLFKEITNEKHHIPLCVWDANIGLKRWFIAGIMDGDGFITKAKRPTPPNRIGKFQYRIGIGGVKEGWIHEFRQLLNEMQVKCSKVWTTPKRDDRKLFCSFTINPKAFFDAQLFFTIKRKKERCAIASTTTR